MKMQHLVFRLLTILLTLTIAFSLNACGFGKTNTSQEDNIAPPAYDADEPWDNSESLETDFSGQPVAAFGAFSEGLAFSFLSSGEPCYIDSSGIPVIFLQQGQYGFPFSEGTAVVTGEHPSTVRRTIKDFGPSSSGFTFSMINRNGVVVIPEGEYSLINPMSNGLSFAYRRNETYSGTEKEYSFLDSNGNVVVSLNPDDVGMSNENEIKNWNNIRYNDAGFCVIERRGISDNYTLVFDRSGNLVYHTIYSISGLEVDPDHYFTVTTGGTRLKTQVIEFGSFRPVMEYGLGMLNDRYCDPEVFLADFTIAVSQGKYMAKVDNCGNLIKKAEIYCLRIVDVADNYMIIKMANDFYGVVDMDLELLFEPIREKIEYMGDGLFITESGNVLDTCGNIAFTWDSSLRRCDDISHYVFHYPTPFDAPVFSEGWCLAFDTVTETAVYINEKGEIADFCY